MEGANCCVAKMSKAHDRRLTRGGMVAEYGADRGGGGLVAGHVQPEPDELGGVPGLQVLDEVAQGRVVVQHLLQVSQLHQVSLGFDSGI